MYLVCRRASPLFPYTTLFRSGLFLDRRAFLVSYDPVRDDDGAVLARIMEAAVPVVAGISLEYYFGYVDPTGYGCGTKLPHNVTSLLDRKSTRLNSSHRCISYAVVLLPSFPTRRSSDLVYSLIGARFWFPTILFVMMTGQSSRASWRQPCRWSPASASSTTLVMSTRPATAAAPNCPTTSRHF